jgi:hypothetical protein
LGLWGYQISLPSVFFHLLGIFFGQIVSHWDESISFFLPLSQIAFQQLSDLKAAISSSLQPFNGHDEWTFTWDSDQYSCRKVYSFLQGSHPVSLLFKWMWKISCSKQAQVLLLVIPLG